MLVDTRLDDLIGERVKAHVLQVFHVELLVQPFAALRSGFWVVIRRAGGLFSRNVQLLSDVRDYSTIRE
jgi:hypothetical protein